MKIALGQINPTVGDFKGNGGKIIDFACRAQAAGAGLILFPELSVCGYPPRDLVERTSFVTHNSETLEHIASETQGISVICGVVTAAHAETGKSVMNSAALLRDGKLIHMIQRSDIEHREAVDIAAELKKAFEKVCAVPAGK